MEDREQIKELRRAKKAAKRRARIRSQLFRPLSLSLLILVLLTTLFCFLCSRQIVISDETTVALAGQITGVDKVPSLNRRSADNVILQIDHGEWVAVSITHIVKAGWDYDTFRETMPGQEVSLRLSPQSNILYPRILRLEHDGKVMIDLYEISNQNRNALVIIFTVLYAMSIVIDVAWTGISIHWALRDLPKKKKERKYNKERPRK